VTAIGPSKTQALYLLLKEQIASGVLASGARLPGEPQLASSHGMSRVTVRRALDGLARDGLIRRRAGSGTYVEGEPGAAPLTGDLTNMLAHLARMGRETEVRLLAFGYAPPPAAVADKLGLAAGEEAQCAVRVRMMSGQPFSHLTTYVPARIGRLFTEQDLAATPLLTLLERAGVVAERAEQTISAVPAGPDAAALLEVEIGSPLLSLIRVVRDRDGRGVEHLAALYRPDRYRFHTELTRAGEGGERYWQTAGAPGAAAAEATPNTPTPIASTSSRREAAPRRRKP
jgi:GntR family transcriptional regulator